jgi:hypothetical protein
MFVNEGTELDKLAKEIAISVESIRTSINGRRQGVNSRRGSRDVNRRNGRE